MVFAGRPRHGTRAADATVASIGSTPRP